MKNILLPITFILLSCMQVFSQGYKIDVKFNVYNDKIILGHHRSESLVPDDTVVTNSKGYGVFKGKKKLPGGMYFLFFPNKKYVDILIDENQEFSIKGDTADFSKISFKNDLENEIFVGYRNKMTELNKEVYELRQKEKEGKKVDGNDKKIKKLSEELNELFDDTVEKYPNLFFTKFLKATRDPVVPDTIKEDIDKYYYYRNNFLKDFDYADSRLLRTPIYESKINTYLDNVLPQIPDTLINACDKFIEASRGDDELFRYMMIFLFNKYASSQLMAAENVYVHLAEKYYIKESTWSSEEFINDLKKRIPKQKRCLVGVKSQNIGYFELPKSDKKIAQMIEEDEGYKTRGLDVEKKYEGDARYDEKVKILTEWTNDQTQKKDLHNMKSKYTIIWFWTPDCSHCRKETPKFYEAYTTKKLKDQGVEVLAMYLNKDIKDWTEFSKEQKRWLKFIEEHKLYKWNNAWNPFDPFRTNFDIKSSPVLYLLDENKEILAKRIGWEQAVEILEAKFKVEDE